MTEEPSPSRNAQPAKKPHGLFLKQKNMLRVLYALTPIFFSAVYFFGWRVLAVVAVTYAVGLATEFITSRQRGQPISMACLVTCGLFSLSLPPTVPLWVAAIGIVVGILFGKEVFGGFGRNFANPAIVARAFVYICFPVPLTARFVPVFRGFPGGLAHWSLEGLKDLPAYLADSGRTVADAVSQATPLYVGKNLGPEVAMKATSYWQLFWGDIGGSFVQDGANRILSAGSIGEGCAALILLAGVYLIATRTANWRLPVSMLAGLAAATVLFRHVLGFDQFTPGAPAVAPLLFTLLGGTTLFVTVFMVTDPVSAPKQRPAQYAYAFLIGVFVVVLRWRGVFTAAATFSVLLGNMIGPLLDIGAEAWTARRKARLAAPAVEEASQ